jgi:hypothetical protein
LISNSHISKQVLALALAQECSQPSSRVGHASRNEKNKLLTQTKQGAAVKREKFNSTNLSLSFIPLSSQVFLCVFYLTFFLAPSWDRVKIGG